MPHTFLEKVSNRIINEIPERRYEYVIALRISTCLAVETIDFMTAKSAKLPHHFLRQITCIKSKIYKKFLISFE